MHPQFHLLRYNTQHPLEYVNVNSASEGVPNSTIIFPIVPFNGTSIDSSASQLHFLQYNTQHLSMCVNDDGTSEGVPNSAIIFPTILLNGTSFY